MKISEIQRKDIDSCAFLIKILQSGKFEVEGSAVKSMHDAYQFVQDLSISMANGWNEQPEPQVVPKAVPKNVKVKNPASGSI